MRGIGRTWGPASWEWRSLALHEAGSAVIAGQLFNDSRVGLRGRAGAEGCSSVRGGSVHRSGAVGAAFRNWRSSAVFPGGRSLPCWARTARFTPAFPSNTRI